MSNKHYILIDIETNLYEIYSSHKEAFTVLINHFFQNYYEEYYYKDSFFELKSINDIVDEICRFTDIIFVKLEYSREPRNQPKNFNFSMLNKIEKYNYINGLLITDIGVFTISKEEFEKFEKLFIFK